MAAKRSNTALAILLILSLTQLTDASQWKEYIVHESSDNQEHPDVDGKIIVWQQQVEIDGTTDMNIYGANTDSRTVFTIADYIADQKLPSISGNLVTWQDNYWGDWDVYVTDISDISSPVDYLITPYLADQSEPVIHGNIVVWQHNFEDETTGEPDWDIYAADITEPNAPSVFDVAGFADNQSKPAIYRNMILWSDDSYGDIDIAAADILMRNKPTYIDIALLEADQQNMAIYDDIIVWQDNYYGDWDIYGANMADSDNPEEFSVASSLDNQINPDISKHIVIYQDDRNGDWDIYGYNLITKTEFQITDDSADQINPAISDDTVVWQDNRDGNWKIYAVKLTGPEIADCGEKLPGDANNDCQVDMADFALLVSNWLQCNLSDDQACW